jgi:broad specificity phosphatase PhoE
MILIRHGESEFNVHYAATRRDPGIRDPKLTDKGHTQVRDAARFIADLEAARGLTTILSSPYTRTLQTAEILAEHLNLPIAVDVQIGEHAHFTCDIGTPRSQLRDLWPSVTFDHLDEEWWPEGEDNSAVSTRAAGFRSHAAGRDDWHRLLIVSHWGFIRGLTGHRVPNAAVLRFDPLAPHPTGADILSPAELAQDA